MLESTKIRIKTGIRTSFRFRDVSTAFQPIIDIASARVWGYEALTRGSKGQTYPQIIEGMSETRRIDFDKLVTIKAMREATRLGLTKDGAKITLNVRPTVNRAAVDALFVRRVAKHFQLDLGSIVLELTEDAKLSCEEFHTIVELHRELGIATGIDDFGSGYSGLNVLATCGAAIVKLDRHLIREIDVDVSKRMIVESFTQLCGRLGSTIIAEGVETQREAEVLSSLGVRLMQGYYFGRPTVGGPSVLRLVVGGQTKPIAWHRPQRRWSVPTRVDAKAIQQGQF